MVDKSDASTAAFYAAHPWPGPDAMVSRKWALRLRPYIREGAFEFLDAGCGSGQYTAGMLLEYPQARAVAIDLSERSLEDSRSLLRTAGVEDRAEVLCRSFSDPLPWKDRFDVVIANGSIHHSPDPVVSFVHIAKSMKVGGLLGCMVYGIRSNARRYEVKEMLHLLTDGDVEEMYKLYSAYDRVYGSIFDKPLRTLIRDAKLWVGRRLSRWSGKEEQWGYDPRTDHKQVFIDGYAAPIDAAFTSREIQGMLSAAGLELCEMLSGGRSDESVMPAEWVQPWKKLSEWDRIRVSELVTPTPMSFSFIARRSS